MVRFVKHYMFYTGNTNMHDPRSTSVSAGPRSPVLSQCSHTCTSYTYILCVYMNCIVNHAWNSLHALLLANNVRFCYSLSRISRGELFISKQRSGKRENLNLMVVECRVGHYECVYFSIYFLHQMALLWIYFILQCADWSNKPTVTLPIDTIEPITNVF